MKKIIFLIFVSLSGISQTVNHKIQSYLDQNRDKLGLTHADVSSWHIESTANSESTGINNYYIKQKYQGIEVFNSLSNFWVKNDEVINGGSEFIQNIASKTNTTIPTINVIEAFAIAISSLNEAQVQNIVILEQNGYKMKLSNGSLTSSPVLANLVYQLTENNELRLAWDFNFYSQNQNHLWSVRLDAVDGKILDKHDLVVNCNFGPLTDHSKHKHKHNHNINNPFVSSFAKDFYKAKTSLEVQSGSYRVYPFNIESPNHGSRQLIASPHNTTASPFGWHDTNGVTGAESNITLGNNVYAQEDTDADNFTSGFSPDGGASLLFDYPYGGNGVAATTYQDASLTNLFYMNNIMHDVWYQYGFNELNGNFQSNNYGKGGVANDYVIADGQDASSFNNATFGTPVDGSSPRMQMYLWNVAPLGKLTITSPASIAGTYSFLDNAFSPGNVPPPNWPSSITNQLVLFDDGTPDNANACTPAINASLLAGKIAVIYRGDCTFIAKTLAAQDAGAIAVIIVNNVAGGLNMTGADAFISIPCILVTQATGDSIITAINNGDIVNGKISNIPAGSLPFVNADGSFDNGIMAHEYGHGISNRLTGGPNNSSCLTNNESPNEGWSDWFWLIMQIKPTDNGSEIKGIATYASSEPTDGYGIRRYPYTTNTTINPLTFSNSNTEFSINGRHGLGSVWATILWDLTWAYIEKYGFNPDIYNTNGLNKGNNLIMRLVIDAMKLQPCNPTMVQARDAIIAADLAATNGQDYCMIWRVFAARGMGINSNSGTGGSTNATNQTENFTQPTPGTTPATGSNCTALAIDSFDKTDLLNIYPNPSNGLLTIKLANYNTPINIFVTDLNGRIVFNQRNITINSEKSINLNTLQNGMYILKIENAELNISKKIILN